MSWVAAGVSAGTLIYGAVKSGQAKKEASKLAASRPQLTASPYTQDELSLSKSELANGGMSADASRFLQEGNDRSESNSIDAILKGGGSVNNVAQIFDSSQSGNQRLALMKENLRLNKINNFVSASRNANEERQQMFQYNTDAPWKDAAQANAQARQSASQMEVSGISGIAGAAGSALGKQQLNKYLNPSDASTVSSQPVSNSSGTPNVVETPLKPLNLNFNNSSNTSPWDTPGNS